MAENPLTPFSAGAVGFFRRIFGAAATELGELLADKVRHYRSKNLEKVLEKGKALIGNQPTKELPLRFSIPFFEKASLDDSEELGDLWAKLLAEAATEFREDHYLFVDIISRLTPSSAKLLDSIVGEFYQQDDWYESIQVDFNFLNEIEEKVVEKIKPGLYKWKLYKTGLKLANKFFDFDTSDPFLVFYVNLPSLSKKDEDERLAIKKRTGNYGFVCMAFSREGPSLNLLEREQLVRRASHELEVSYGKIDMRYVVATPLGVQLVAIRHLKSEGKAK